MMGTGEDAPRGQGLRICLVVSQFNEPITAALERGARDCLLSAGVVAEDIEVLRVPGAWELPLGVLWMLERGEFDAIIALGCVIRGETPHFEYISMGATVGLEALSREYAIPLGFGLLTTEDGDQAKARAGGAKGNKGHEAALAVLHMCRLADRLG